MKVFGLIIAMFMTVLAIADEMPNEWTKPTFKDFDIRCINMEGEHPRHNYRFYAKFFRCEDVPWAKEYNYECLAFMIVDEENNLVSTDTLTRGVYYVAPEIKEKHEAILNPDKVYYFSLTHLVSGTEWNQLSVFNTPDEKYSWGYQAHIAYQIDDTYVGTFPAICQFKNHFPEEG